MRSLVRLTYFLNGCIILLFGLENNKGEAHLQRKICIRFWLYLVQVFVHLGCCNKNAIDWEIYKQQKIISCSLEAGKFKIKVPGDLVSGNGLLPDV